MQSHDIRSPYCVNINLPSTPPPLQLHSDGPKIAMDMNELIGNTPLAFLNHMAEGCLAKIDENHNST
ncbi:hypothetical protein GQ600_10037 [Phytophthora cactorum]|nr:hypothetical protein GQ600_10037 [Phytophthora cactorum]